MGFSTFEERIDKTKIKYRVRLQHMNEKKWVRKIFKWRNRLGKFKQTNKQTGD